MKFLFTLATLVLVSSITQAKICEVSIRTVSTSSSSTYLETKCSDGELSSTEYKTREEALKDFTIVTESWSKTWKISGCNYEALQEKLFCTFEIGEKVQNHQSTLEQAVKVQTHQSHPPIISIAKAPNTLNKCEENQIMEVKKAKDSISTAAIGGLGAGAVAGAAGAASIAAVLFPFVSTTMALDGGRGGGSIEKDLAMFVIGGAVVVGAIAMVGTSTSAWFNYQSSDKLANRNLVFFRDIRSDGVGPEFETRAQMILQSLRDKEVYFGKDLSLIDKFLSKPVDRNDIRKIQETMSKIELPEAVFNIDNISAELKFVGQAYLSSDSLLKCGEPKELYVNISLQTISRLLNKYVNQ